ncbi:MAG: sugar phosphate isomerase/epimerase family protein [Lacrimispora sp.]|uniref:sugar phosphate isomerase/epimerase family protein n=1 Tax=Lacrimispora sp. TaxID=2719234 RepID=UPI0039E4DD3B
MKLSYPVAVPDAGVKVMAWCDEFETVFYQLKKMGYEGIELLVRDPQTVDISLLDRLLEDNGLVLSAIGTTPMQTKDGLFLMHQEEAVRQEALKRLYQLIELAAHYQTSVLVGKYRGMTGEEYYVSLPYLKEVLEGACNTALSYGVDLYLEPQSSGNINNLNTVAQTLEWTRLCGCSNLKILADVYHMSITEPDTGHSIKSMGNALGMVHMSDSDRLIPGCGQLELDKVMKELRDINFRGFVSMEIKQQPDSKTAAQKSAEYLLKCIGEKR